MVKIALVDDEPLFRKGVAGILDRYSQYEIICSVSNGKELLDEINEKGIKPDIFLLDLRMDCLDGIETTKKLSKQYDECKIIILTSFYSPSFASYMVNLGVNAFLSKYVEPSELVFAIDIVHERGLYITPDYANAIRSKLKTQKKPCFNSHESLTKKELEVLYWICHGCTNQEISDKVCRSVRTIEGHRQHIIEKTGAKNTASMVLYALMHRVIDIDQKLLEHTLA